MSIVSNIDQIIGELEQQRAEVNERINQILSEIAQESARRIAEDWPVDTGLSKAGWRGENQEEGTWSVINDVEYTEYVHDGMAETLVPDVIEEVAAEFEERLESVLKEV